MRDEVFSALATLLRDRSGLALPRDKEYLLESRLGPVARKHGLDSIDALFLGLRGPKKSAIEADIVEAMTTNESFFFRDAAIFQVFRTVLLPNLLSARAASKRLRIWFAACSSGQEPYSITMILEEEKAKLAGWTVDMVATDISTEMIQRARDGLYTHFEAQRGLPIQMLAKYFTKEDQGWRIKQPLRDRIKFQNFNLLDGFGALGNFDIIFCRNVLIYFALGTKRDILDRMARQLASDGALFLGGAETVIGVTDKFMPHPGHAGIFVPGQAPALDRAVGQ